MKAKKIYEPKNNSDYLENDDYIAELKYDGQRRFLVFDNGETYLTNKQGDRREIPQELLDEVEEVFIPELKTKNPFFTKFILDGELVYIDPSTGSNHRTQKQNPKAELTYMVFDIIQLGEEDLTDKDINGKDWTWFKRRAELETLCEFAEWLPGEDKCVCIVDYVKSTKYKKKLLEYAQNNAREGLVLKNINSTYNSENKTDMIKIKFSMSDDYIVIGYTEATGTKTGKREKYFGALVLAQYDKNNNLKPTGRVGGGFNDKELEEVTKLLNKKHSKVTQQGETVIMGNKSLNDKDYNSTYGTIHWLRPADWFVIEIKMMNLTEYGTPFLPRFVCVRDDKKPIDCKGE